MTGVQTCALPIYLPDPVKEDIVMLQRENSALCNKIIDLETQIKELQKDRKDIREDETL